MSQSATPLVANQLKNADNNCKSLSATDITQVEVQTIQTEMTSDQTLETKMTFDQTFQAKLSLIRLSRPR